MSEPNYIDQITLDGVTRVIRDTTLESKQAASGGTDVSLVTTGEKYTWNNKASSSDLSDKADKTDTVLLTTLSRNRKANTTVGTGSFAFGTNVEASGDYSHAEGMSTARGNYSHSEGMSTASGNYSHAEGISTASGSYSHGEGLASTASGDYSHAEGMATASGNYSHAEGMTSTASGMSSHAEGTGTASGAMSYASGQTTIANSLLQHVFGNSNVADTGFISEGSKGTYVEIVGNGENANNRSNAYALTWTGDGKYAGDVYVGCSTDSSGGSKLAKITDIPSITGKADKVASATSGNFATLDSNGNLTDSGHKHSDYLTSAPVTDVQVNGTSVLSGGVANVPVAAAGILGVAKFNPDNGVGVNSSGNAVLNSADSSLIKAGSNQTRAIAPVRQHESVFFGLSKVAGVDLAEETVTVGTYPASSQAAIQTMLGVPSTSDLSNKLSTSLKGAANGLAELDANGLVPSAQLPSYVDDVLEYSSVSAFPATGETGKIYVATDTNITYRWSGTTYVEISPSLALGETSSTAYRGDRGATAYTHASDASRLTTAQSSGLYKIATTAEGHVASATSVQKSDITALGIPGKDTTITSEFSRPSYIDTGTIGDVTLQPLVNDLRGNHLAFLPADQIIIEKTTDGGTTWVDAGVSDDNKLKLFAEMRPNISIPQIDGKKNVLCGIRVTITAMKYNVPANTPETSKYNYWNSTYVQSQERYNNIKDFYFWVSTGPDKLKVKIEAATGATPNAWTTLFNNETARICGWSGNDYVRVPTTTFGGSTTQTTNNWNLRLTFMSAYATTASDFNQNYITGVQSICEIRGYGTSCWTAGNKYAGSDHMYSWDQLKNVTFPAKITATNYVGKINGVTVPSDPKFTDTTYESKTAASGGTDVSLVTTGEKYTWNNKANLSDIPSVTGKADKVSNATTGNFAALDANGNLTDSGHKHSDYLTSAPVTDVQINGTSVLSSGVANIPMASANNLGLVKINSTYGIIINSQTGEITVSPASSANAKAGTEVYKPISPVRQHESVFYGLAKAAGDSTQSSSSNTVGTYTSDAKAAIQTMLDVPSNDDLDLVYDNIAQNYDDITFPVAKNKYCIHEGKLYRAKQDISTSEAWTAGHWEEYQISTVMYSNEANLNTLGAALSVKYQKPSGGIPASDMTSAVQTSLGLADTAYQKPSGGIPASDIASGVIPDPTSIIDDTAGSGDTNKTWSADKSHDETLSLKNSLDVKTLTNTFNMRAFYKNNKIRIQASTGNNILADYEGAILVALKPEHNATNKKINVNIIRSWPKGATNQGTQILYAWSNSTYDTTALTIENAPNSLNISGTGRNKYSQFSYSSASTTLTYRLVLTFTDSNGNNQVIYGAQEKITISNGTMSSAYVAVSLPTDGIPYIYDIQSDLYIKDNLGTTTEDVRRFDKDANPPSALYYADYNIPTEPYFECEFHIYGAGSGFPTDHSNPSYWITVPFVEVEVRDVQVNGTSIVSNGIANVPDISGKIDKPTTAGTSGQVLTCDGNGGQSWQNASALPAVTSADNGKVLRVVDGAWAVATIASASGVSF